MGPVCGLGDKLIAKCRVRKSGFLRSDWHGLGFVSAFLCSGGHGPLPWKEGVLTALVSCRASARRCPLALPGTCTGLCFVEGDGRVDSCGPVTGGEPTGLSPGRGEDSLAPDEPPDLCLGSTDAPGGGSEAGAGSLPSACHHLWQVGEGKTLHGKCPHSGFGGEEFASSSGPLQETRESWSWRTEEGETQAHPQDRLEAARTQPRPFLLYQRMLLGLPKGISGRDPSLAPGDPGWGPHSAQASGVTVGRSFHAWL